MLGYLVAAAVVVWVAQTVLGLWQFKKFNKHLLEMRQEGRVAIGRARGRFAAGVLVLFVIDEYSARRNHGRSHGLCRFQTV